MSISKIELATVSIEQEDWARIVAYAWLNDTESLNYHGESYESFQDFLEQDPKKAINYLQESIPQFKDLEYKLITDLPNRPRVSEEILKKVANQEKDVIVIPDGFTRLPAPTLEESLKILGTSFLGNNWKGKMREMLDSIESTDDSSSA